MKNFFSVYGRHTLSAVLFGAFALLSSHGAWAGGLMLYEIGTEDVGLASAGYGARAQDASTVLTNPAGLTRLDGTQTMVGVQALIADFEFSVDRTPNTPSGSGGGNPIGVFPGGSMFLSHSISPDLKLGFGVSGNFGLGEKFNDDWVGRYRGTEALVAGISLLPSIAYRVDDKISVGATLNAMYAVLKTKTAINNIASGFGDGRLKLDDNTWGYGVTLGLMYQADPATRYGLTYSSKIDLDFEPNAEFTSIAPVLNTVLASRGLLNAKIDMGMTVPQALMASVFHQVDDRWAVLGSIGWQDWSEFGYLDIGIDSNDPRSVTKNLDFKDTWHVAVGAQYQMNELWRLNFGVAYDSEFQDGGNISPMIPTNDLWRFGIGAQTQPSKTFGWGVAAELVYGGNLDVNKVSDRPVTLGSRGDVVGSYDDVLIYFLAANFNWKF